LPGPFCTPTVTVAPAATVIGALPPFTVTVVGCAGCTLTVIAAEVAVLPAASLATAVKLCEPLLAVVVFHEIEYGAAVTSAPRFTPSSLNCTPTTPTLSVALAETVTVPETEAPATGAVMETAGGVASFTTVNMLVLVAVPPGVVTLSGPVVAPVGTVSRIVVAEATVKGAALTPLNVTAVAPVKFVPVIVTMVPSGPLVGVRLVIVGGITTVTLTADEVVWLPAASRATAVKLCEPLLAGVVFHEIE